MSDYTSVPSTGKLKLKGVKDGRVEKKKKKKRQPAEDGQNADRSVVLRKLEDEDAKAYRDTADKPDKINPDNEDEDLREHLKTDAEKRYDEQRRKRLEKRLEKEGVKTHKERVEELNKYLSNLSEHHDMPKIGPG